MPSWITARVSRACPEVFRDPSTTVTGETFPAFPAHAQPAILRIWYETHVQFHMLVKINTVNQRGTDTYFVPHHHLNHCNIIFVGLLSTHYNGIRIQAKMFSTKQVCFQIRSVICFIVPYSLTHSGQVTHICVGNLTIIGSVNGLSPGRRQAIIWTNDGILLIWPLGTNFSEILIEIPIFSFQKMQLKMSSAKCRPFCLGLNVLTKPIWSGWRGCNDYSILFLTGNAWIATKRRMLLNKSAPNFNLNRSWQKLRPTYAFRGDDLLNVALWRHLVLQILVNVGSNNRLLFDGTDPLPEPTLTHLHRGSSAFVWE